MPESINKINTTKHSDDGNAHADFLAFLQTRSKKEVDTKEAEPAVVANADGQRMKTEFTAAVKEEEEETIAKVCEGAAIAGWTYFADVFPIKKEPTSSKESSSKLKIRT